MGKNITSQKRGKGSPSFRAYGFRFKGEAKLERKKSARILDLVKCRAHSAPLAVVEYDDGTPGFLIASEGFRVGNYLSIGGGSEIIVGNSLPLKDLPEGIPIYNIEKRPGDGGRFVRSSGLSARIITKTNEKIIVKLPSKKKMIFNPDCMATIGIVAGGGRPEKPFLKAGKMVHYMKKKNRYYPITSGAAMNAVAHPFGNKRTSRKSKARPAPKNAPPGRNVGMIHPKRTGRKKGTQG